MRKTNKQETQASQAGKLAPMIVFAQHMCSPEFEHQYQYKSGVVVHSIYVSTLEGA